MINLKLGVATIQLFLLTMLYSAHAQSCLSFTVDDDSCEVFRTVLHCETPVLQNDMPVNIRQTYVTYDSICRNLTSGEMRGAVADLSDDSLRMGVRAINTAFSYDPVLFKHQVRHSYSKSPTKYKCDFNDLVSAIFGEYQERFGLFSKRQFLCLTDFIIRARVQSVSVRNNSGYWGDSSSTETTQIYCADIQVTEPIFGTIRYNFCNNEGDKRPGDCFRVGWGRIKPNCYTSFRDSLAEEQRNGMLHLVVDNEYILFINFSFSETTGTNTCNWVNYIDAFFEISQDGYVLDNTQIFEMGTRIEFNDFREKIHSIQRNF